MTKQNDFDAAPVESVVMPCPTKKIGFATKVVERQVRFNEYDCPACRDAGIDHAVVSVPHGVTDCRSCWGPGIPTTRLECNHCNRWSGPWVSTAHVGDCW